jgi:Tfp pilus assembly protein PilO
LQQLAALPPYALSSPDLTTVTITPIKPATVLETLLQQISELADQQALTLLALQQPSGADQSRSQSTQLILEVMGSYQPLLNFLIALGNTQHPLTIDTLMLQREEQTSDIKLTLGLSLTELTEAPS